MRKLSDFLPRLTSRESTAGLLIQAMELHRHAVAGNKVAIEEIERGLILGSKWEYIGIIWKNEDGTYSIRDAKEKLTTSGPVPLSGSIYKHPPNAT